MCLRIMTECYALILLISTPLVKAFAARMLEEEKALRQDSLKKTLEESVCMQGWILIRDTYLPNLHSALEV